jgi:hypothetical protein
MLSIDWTQFHSKLDNYYNISHMPSWARHHNTKYHKDIDRLMCDNDLRQHHKPYKLPKNLYRSSNYSGICSISMISL